MQARQATVNTTMASSDQRLFMSNTGTTTGSSVMRSSTSTPMMTSSSTSNPDDTSEMTEDSINHIRGSQGGGAAGRRLQIDEDESQIYLSVMWHDGKLGVAYYSSETAEIYIMNDTVETDNYSLLRKVCHQIQPCCVIASSKADERLLLMLQDLGGIDSCSGASEALPEENGNRPIDVQLLPSLDFSLDVCKRRVLSMSLPSIPDHFTETDRTIYMSSLLSFDATCMIRATGGLLKYLEKKRIGVELERSDVNSPVLTIKTFSLSDMVSIHVNTYSSLQIFQKESHPSVYKSGGSGAKEGLSLFGVLNRTRSVIGSRLMRLWFLRPSRNLDLLRERQEAVSFFLNPRNAEVTGSLQNCLKSIKNVPRIFKQMQQAQASMSDWQSLYKTAYNATNIAEICRAQRVNVPIFTKITEAFTDDIHHVAAAINQLVDFEESFAQNRFVVKPRVDEELDQRKRTYSTLPSLMTTVAREELDRLGAEIEECSIIYVPQLGYLLAIPCTQHMTDTKDFTIEGLQFMFMSNNIVHYKSTRTRALDVKLGDTHCDITDHETQIMHKLQNDILRRSQVFYAIMDYAAELDCLIALAIAAKEGNYIRPDLTEGSQLDILGGRHPLQELCVTPFVPNDAHFGGDHTRVKVITGPNASGKSVYLKQVGLIAFMALIGSFVPAEKASIGMLDGIYTRIHTQESVSVGLSTFMIDLNQLSAAVRDASKNSLVIVDEFGKSTDTVDGLSLLVNTIKHWLGKGLDCPNLMVSTHFHAIIREGLLPASDQLSYQTMEILENEGELVFLYQLTDGHANYSHASHIALTAGLPEELVKRGIQVSKLLRENQPIHRVDSTSSESQFQRYTEILSKFLDLDLDFDDLTGFLREQVLSSPSSASNKS